ncbi:hypothetical protein TrispH2_008829 [Trichoplax sp. H2]|nr:hypothetical protein TrispH2_008829 [Trichoplax sp. H2]|eukprot:RDD39117.1 hypothetical protein TrispH2_008829 [Trichoplax sp. H2]
MSQGSGHKRSDKSQEKSMYYNRGGNHLKEYRSASPRSDKYCRDDVTPDSQYNPTHIRDDVIDHRMAQELQDQELARMLWKQEIQLARRRHEHEYRRTHSNNSNNSNKYNHNGNVNPHDKRSPSSSSSQYSDSPSQSNVIAQPVSGGFAANSSGNDDHRQHRNHRRNGNQRMYYDNGNNGHDGGQSYYDNHSNRQYRYRKEYPEFQTSDRSSNSDFQGSEDGDIHHGMSDIDWNPMKHRPRRQAQSDSSQSQDNSFESSNRTHLPKQFRNEFIPRSQFITEENNREYDLSSRFRNSDGGKRWDMNRKAASKLHRQNHEFPLNSSHNMPVSNTVNDFRSPIPHNNDHHAQRSIHLPNGKATKQEKAQSNGVNGYSRDDPSTPNGRNQPSKAINNSDEFEHEYEIVEPEDINNIVTRNIQGPQKTTSNVLAAIDPTVNKYGVAISDRPNNLDYENSKKKQFAVRQIVSREDAIAMLQAGSPVLSQQLVVAKRRVSPSKTNSSPLGDDRPKSKVKEFFQNLNHKKGKTSK